MARLSRVLSSHPAPFWASDLLFLHRRHSPVSHSVRKGEWLSNQQIMALALLLLDFQNPAWSSHLIPELLKCKLTVDGRREGERVHERAL